MDPRFHGDDEKSVSVIPAQAGIYLTASYKDLCPLCIAKFDDWIPVFTGMTRKSVSVIPAEAGIHLMEHS